jgi:hypothetical protein
MLRIGACAIAGSRQVNALEKFHQLIDALGYTMKNIMVPSFRPSKHQGSKRKYNFAKAKIRRKMANQSIRINRKRQRR